jgi:hypothetical protein
MFHQFWLLMKNYVPPLIELHVVPGICTGDETFVVVFCPSRPLAPLPHDHRVLSVLVANEIITTTDRTP